MKKIKQINDKNFAQTFSQCDKPLVIKFYNSTCHLCAGLKPVYEQLSTMYENYDFAECNASNSRNLFKFFNVSGVPTLYIVNQDYRKEIPYPENPDPETGYSLYDIADFLDTFKR